MSGSELIGYCLEKAGAFKDFPFGNDCTVIKVRAGKFTRIFTQIFVHNGKPTATLNCDKMTGDFYRGLYPGIIVRGYHCPPVQQPYFNTFPLDGSVPDDFIKQMADHSYETVIGKLPKYARKLLEELQ